MNAVIVWFVIGVACLLGELFTISFVLFFSAWGPGPPHWSRLSIPVLNRNWPLFYWCLWRLFLFCAAVWLPYFVEARLMRPALRLRARRNSPMQEHWPR